jgi:hypothetical protein
VVAGLRGRCKRHPLVAQEAAVLTTIHHHLEQVIKDMLVLMALVLGITQQAGVAVQVGLVSRVQT